MFHSNEHEPGVEEDFLLVRSDDRRFAVPADRVRRVVRNLTLHPVPGGCAPLAGLAVYAGEPLAVVDLLALTGGDELQGGGRVTVVVSRQHAAGRGLLGLAVQEALHVFALSLDEIEAQERGPITGVVRTDDGDIEIVDPLRIGSSTPTVEGGLFFATDPKDPDGGA